MRYVVLDFEATCDEPLNPDPQEIIEFPAVLVDPATPNTSAEFHTFLRPTAHPRLTRFCLDLTGISQAQVDRGIPFPAALARFDEWRASQGLTDFLMVTCGDWDLGSLLPRQCVQHNLPVPDWGNRWCNLKRLFAWHFPQASDRTRLAEMAAALGIPLQGRLHSGIDDARNIARILQRLLDMDIAGVPTAFWRCLVCGEENRYRDRECAGCGRSSVTLQPGDWGCPRCGFGNFASRDKCFDCGTARPGAAAPALKPGDWLCGACAEHNFARRTNCFKCGTARR
jgi:ERI1 exoribonuclease 3